MTVDLWTIALDRPCPLVLSPDEVTRAGRFKFEADGVRWSRARSWLRTVLARYTDATDFTYGPHGKPALRGVEFNLSHAGEFAMIAVSAGPAVGVDIERIRPNVDIARLLRRIGERDLPETTDALYERWTRREAISKAMGGGLFDPPVAGIEVTAVTAPAGYAASVALIGSVPVVRYLETPGLTGRI